MALPLPNYLSEEQGGGIVNSMTAGNALANANHLRRYNKAKADYGPQTLMAEAASKLAYANLMGPQFLAKAMSDPNFMGNLSEQQKNEINRIVYGAGSGQGTGNAIRQMPSNPQSQPQNPIASMWHQFMNTINPRQQGNAVANMGQLGVNTNNRQMPIGQAQPQEPAQGSLVNENGTVIDEHGDSNTPVTPEQARSLQSLNDEGDASSNPMPMTLTTGNKSIPEGTYANKGGKFEGAHKQEAKLGDIRAGLQKDIYDSNTALGSSGVVIDNLIDDFTKPEFVALRNQFPYLQDMQLEAASHLGNPATQQMIGKIKAEIESFKGATVMGFGGRPLVTEFHYAEKLKPTTKDTVYTATGKLQALKELHDIAVQKNNLIDQYLEEGKLTPNQALAKANKMVDTRAIKKKVEELTAPATEIENPKTHARMWITFPRAKELGFSEDHIKKLGIKK